MADKKDQEETPKQFTRRTFSDSSPIKTVEALAEELAGMEDEWSLGLKKTMRS
jgi:hypothetical protein